MLDCFLEMEPDIDAWDEMIEEQYSEYLDKNESNDDVMSFESFRDKIVDCLIEDISICDYEEKFI